MNRLLKAIVALALLAMPHLAGAANEGAPGPSVAAGAETSAPAPPPASSTAPNPSATTAPAPLPSIAEPSEIPEGQGASSDVASSAPPPPAPVADPDEPDLTSDTDPSALTEFEDELEPYGAWVVDDTYGQVWVPHRHYVGAHFAPYVTSGYWALTASGQWIWVSDHPFGWVVYHYGRWVYVPGLGWSWIPGRRYAPAWVVFRTSFYGDPYLGWAPLPPRYVWMGGRAVRLRRVPPTPYVFCPTGRVFHSSVDRWILRDRGRTRALAERSRPYIPSRPTIRVGPSLREVGIERDVAARVTRTPRALPLRRSTTEPTNEMTRPEPKRAIPAERSAPEKRATPKELPKKARPRPPPPPPPPPKEASKPRKKSPPTVTPLKPFPRQPGSAPMRRRRRP